MSEKPTPGVENMSGGEYHEWRSTNDRIANEVRLTAKEHNADPQKVAAQIGAMVGLLTLMASRPCPVSFGAGFDCDYFGHTEPETMCWTCQAKRILSAMEVKP